MTTAPVRPQDELEALRSAVVVMQEESMSKKSPQIEALEKTLGTPIPTNARIDIVIQDLDVAQADDVKGGQSLRTVPLGTISSTKLNVADKARVGHIIAGLNDVMCW